MKNILLILCSSLFLSSCIKEHCYSCREVVSYNNVIAPSEYGDPYTLCGYTKREIKKYKDSHFVYTANISTTVECEGIDE